MRATQRTREVLEWLEEERLFPKKYEADDQFLLPDLSIAGLMSLEDRDLRGALWLPTVQAVSRLLMEEKRELLQMKALNPSLYLARITSELRGSFEGAGATMEDALMAVLEKRREAELAYRGNHASSH